MLKKKQKNMAVLIVVCLLFSIMPTVNAMHIMEGYLSPGYCIAWGILCFPFLVMGYLNIKRKVKRK